jgi:citrate lyase beta subunit
MVEYIQAAAKKAGLKREIPIHVLIETHGALRDVEKIATLPWPQVIDFGLMDFISGHHGAIALSNMKSPGQFDHKLLARAKSNCVAAALANGVVPAHNVTLDPYWPQTQLHRAHGSARRCQDHPESDPMCQSQSTLDRRSRPIDLFSVLHRA